MVNVSTRIHIAHLIHSPDMMIATSNLVDFGMKYFCSFGCIVYIHDKTNRIPNRFSGETTTYLFDDIFLNRSTHIFFLENERMTDDLLLSTTYT